MNWLARFLLEPNVRGLDPDSEEIVRAHYENIRKKPLVRSAFKRFYELFSDISGPMSESGTWVELGSGVGFISELLPLVKTSDVRLIPGLDYVVDAQNMPFPDGSISGIFAINVFHHLSEPEVFWHELDRVLMPGGICVLVEPARSPVSRFIHSRLHSDEYFDLDEDLGENRSESPMKGANQARIHILLGRGTDNWSSGSIHLERREPVDNFLSYVLSGGLNFRQLVPTWFSPAIRTIESRWLSKLHGFLAVHELFVFRKS